MTGKLFFRCCILAICPAAACAGTAPGTPDLPASAGSFHLTYAEEFNDNSTATDLAGWTYDLGTGPPYPGWGNDESEVYTNSAANVSVSTSNGVGALNIDAIQTGTGGSATYTSGRIQSTGTFDQTYGVIEFRAQLPAGSGLWPAVWMLPENSTYGSWPTSGEIDIMESKGSTPNFVQGSLHTGSSSSTEYNQTAIYDPSGFNPTSGYHTYDLVWNAGSLNRAGSFQWYVDGNLYETQTGWAVPSNAPAGDDEAPFDEPFYLLINLAVGGTYGGAISLTPNKSYDMAIDYVQAYTAGYVLGDTNNDGVVNNLDLTTLTNNLGKEVTGGFSDGDFNGDGVVNQDDVSLYELGLSEQNANAGAAPEPGCLIAAAAPMIALRRRHGRGLKRAL